MITISDDSSSDEDHQKLQFEKIMKRTLTKQEVTKDSLQLDESEEEDEDYMKLLREIDDNGQDQDSRKEDRDKHFVDLTTWPKTAKNIEDAFKIYNDIGLLKKIQFKRMNCRREDDGFMISFTI